MNAKVLGAIATVVLMVLVGLTALANPNATSPKAPDRSSGLSGATIGEIANAGGACSGVTTCSASLSVGQFSAILIYIAANTTSAPSAVAIYGQTPTLLSSSVATAPTEYIYGVENPLSGGGTWVVYVNFTLATRYAIQVVTFGAVALLNPFVSGTGTASGTGTTATCSLTSTVSGEEAVGVTGATLSETSMALSGGASSIGTSPTKTTAPIFSTEFAIWAVGAAGLHTITNTLTTSTVWQTACLAFLPSGTPTAPVISLLAYVPPSAIAFTWTVGTGQASYLTSGSARVAPYSGGSCGSYSTYSAVSPFTSVLIVGLVEGNAYCFEATVGNSTGVVFSSNVLMNVMMNAPPTAPTSLAVGSATASSLTLTWTNPSGTLTANAVGYTTTASCGGTLTNASFGVETTQVIAGLVGATTYYFEVAASTNGGQSAYSACVAGTTNGPSPILATGLTVEAVTQTSASLRWALPVGVTLANQTLLWGPTCGGSYTQVSEGATAISAVVTTLSPNTTYAFVIETWTASAQASTSCVLAHTFGPATVSVTTWHNSTYWDNTTKNYYTWFNTTKNYWDNVTLVHVYWDNTTLNFWDNTTKNYYTWTNSSKNYWDNTTHVYNFWDNTTVKAWDNTTKVYWTNSTATHWYNTTKNYLSWTNTTKVYWDNTTVNRYANTSYFANRTVYHNSTSFDNATYRDNSTFFNNRTTWTNGTRWDNRTVWSNVTTWHNATVDLGPLTTLDTWVLIIGVVTFLAAFVAAARRRYPKDPYDEP